MGYVFDAKTDVFVLFYAPESPKSQDLLIEWAKLAQVVAKKRWASLGLVLGKIDASNNESPEDVVNVPKLALYPAVDAKQKMKKRKVFNGKRLADSMVDFLLENAKNLAAISEEL